MLTFSHQEKHVEMSYYWPEVGLSKGVQKVRFAAQSFDKQSEESYHPPSALGHKLTVTFYSWCTDAWKANGYLPFSDSDRFTQQ